MPPTLPDKKIRGCFLFRMFRPEFVKSYSKPLSSGKFFLFWDLTRDLSTLLSDACSPWFDMHDPNREEHAVNIQVATDYLLNGVIPKAATLLDKHGEKISTIEVLEYLHASGINLRYDDGGRNSTVLVDVNIRGRYLAQVYKHSLSAYFRLILLLEMVARVIKNKIWHMLREAKRTLQ